MPLKAELNAVKKNYMKLMKLPVKDLLPALKVAGVVSDDQREQMNAMTLDKERAGYLIDNVITPSLKVDIQEIFYNFLQVLEDDDNPVVKVVANDLRSQLGPSMPPQPCEGSVHTPYHGQTLPQQYPSTQGQTPPQQYPLTQAQTAPQQYPPYQGQMPPQQYPPYQGQTPPQQYSPYQGQTPPQQYPLTQGQMPSRQYPPYQGQMPPQQYPPYQGQMPSQQYPPYQGETPPQQYSPYQGQTPPQQYSPYQGQTPPQQYPPYQGQTPPQQYSPYQGQTPPQQYPPYQGHPMMPPQGGPLSQTCISPAQMIKIESCLMSVSNKETGCLPSGNRLPANNRNVHAVCLISVEVAEGTMFGTGFIADLTMPNSSSPVTVLVTNHHVIHNLSEARKATYQFSYLRSDSDDTPRLLKGNCLVSQNPEFYTCEDLDQNDILLDYTVVQVHEELLNNIMIKSELDGETFPLSACKFDLDNPAMPSNTNGMETICMFHCPRCQPLKRSAQGSINLGHLLFYSCDTDAGSSGAPVFKVVNGEIRLIALHRASWHKAEFNFGTLITKMMEHMKNGGPAPRMDYGDTCSKLHNIVINCCQPSAQETTV